MTEPRLAYADTAFLQETLEMRMPFGKYEGDTLMQLPMAYLEWFARQGFPNSRLGKMLATVYEIKLNGLEHVVRPLLENRR